MGVTAAEAGERMSMREMIDWMGFGRYREVLREQARETARLKRETEKRKRRGGADGA